jgi:hypothetical protein
LGFWGSLYAKVILKTLYSLDIKESQGYIYVHLSDFFIPLERVMIYWFILPAPILKPIDIVVDYLPEKLITRAKTDQPVQCTICTFCMGSTAKGYMQPSDLD